MQSEPAPALEVIEAEFLLQLLMGLLAHRALIAPASVRSGVAAG